MATALDSDIKFLPGVGERRAALLNKELGVYTFGDLLYYFPFRYIDRTKVFKIAEVGGEVPAYIQIRALVGGLASEGQGRKQPLRVSVTDGTVLAELVWLQDAKRLEKRL